MEEWLCPVPRQFIRRGTVYPLERGTPSLIMRCVDDSWGLHGAPHLPCTLVHGGHRACVPRTMLYRRPVNCMEVGIVVVRYHLLRVIPLMGGCDRFGFRLFAPLPIPFPP